MSQIVKYFESRARPTAKGFGHRDHKPQKSEKAEALEYARAKSLFPLPMPKGDRGTH